MLLAVMGMLFSCQRIELPEQDSNLNPGEGVSSGKATISFTAMLPATPQTKAMGDEPTADIKSMHLVVFDSNGMLVETSKAIPGSSKTHDGHNYESTFEVTLSITDQPRIIHLIANCPVDQIAYGHEASIISNLYVTKDNEIETAYWARIEVPDLIVETDEVTGKTSFIGAATKAAFTCVPMLRNYAQIVVRNATVMKSDHAPFVFEGFYVYNTIDRGTVAPYNSKIQGFQSFLDENNEKYSYPELISLKEGDRDVSYEGHALSSATLNRTLSEIVEVNGSDANGCPVSDSYYMYERRVNPMEEDESKWFESPTHLIIKGNYNNEGTSYYKVDLIYPVKNEEGTVEKFNYYHILRNFKYQFTIESVEKSGYPSIDAAIEGAPNNILSGSTTTTKFTNISDRQGRLWVSYTDATLVEGGETTLMYKYIPDITSDAVNNKIAPNHKYGEQGGVIILDDMLGDIITDYKVANKDIVGGPWDGFREVTLTVKDPTDVTQRQAIVVRTDNAALNREVRYYLKSKLNLKVQCVQDVIPASIGEKLRVNILIPDDAEITADMFPMDLAIETWNMSIAPDSELNQLPVSTGPSSIPSKNGKISYYFTKTIETYEDYRNSIVDGYMTIPTHWITSMADNASFIVVTNKYFNYAYDSWVNSTGQALDNPFALFKNLKFTAIPETEGGNVTFSFSYDESVTTTRETVTITFVGVKADPSTDSRLRLVSENAATGTYVYTFTPVAETNGVISLTQKINVKTVSPRGDVSATLESASYKKTTSTDKTRPFYSFSGSFSESGPLSSAANTPVDYSFYVGDPDREITITMDGLDLRSDAVSIELSSIATKASAGTISGSNGKYTYSPNGTTGRVTLSLKTTNTSQLTSTATRSITLSDGNKYYKDETNTIEQKVKQTITATLTFNNTDKRLERTNEKQVWSENDITFTNNKKTTNVTNNSNPIRLYSGQNAIVSVPSGGVITKIVFTCSSKDYANTLRNSIDNSATRSGSTVTVTLNGTSSEYTISSLSGEVRLSSISVTYDK